MDEGDVGEGEVVKGDNGEGDLDKGMWARGTCTRGRGRGQVCFKFFFIQFILYSKVGF